MDTKKWLPAKKVIIPPQAFGKPIYGDSKFPINMEKEEIEKSPDVSTDEPVARQKEKEIGYYFNWPIYWQNRGMGLFSSPISRNIKQDEKIKTGDVHLRSASEIDGYNIEAIDGPLGEVYDFIVDDENWLIKYILVDIRKLLSGKAVKIIPEKINWISWDKKMVSVNYRKDELINKPGYWNYYGYK